MEARLLRSKIILGLMLGLMLVSLGFVQEGIGKYKTVIKTINQFRSYEQTKIQKYLNYLQYGSYGVRIFFVPSAQSIYFINSSTISELTAAMDSGERLRIYNSFKGRSLFTEKTGGFKDFSGIMLLFGSALALFLGYQSFLHKDYLRYLSGFLNRRKLFFSILLARVIIFSLYLMVTVALSLVLLKANGISLDNSEYAFLGIYLLMLIAVWVFFYITGTLVSAFKSRFTSSIVLIIAWFSLIFILPSSINAITYSIAGNIESEKNMEQLTFEILMRVERDMRNKAGILSEINKSIIYEEVKKHLDNEFKELQALEKQLEREMQKNIDIHQQLSILFPSSFYLSCGNEISSKGYANFIRFYQRIQERKHAFIPYIMAKFFEQRSSGNSTDGIESFFKGDEDLFRARPGLPANFLWGILLTLLYILGLTKISYMRFKKSLYL